MRYYSILCGDGMIHLARIVMGSITATNGSYVIYECSDENILNVEELSKDEFEHHCIIATNQYSEN